MNLIKKLEGKKTYIVAVILAVVNLLAQFEVITPEQVKTINALLGALGLLCLRLGVQKANAPKDFFG